MSCRCAVYRWYSLDGSLLYVGQSFTPHRRLANLSAQGFWWCTYAAIRVEEWFESKELAARVEDIAICRERPIGNLHGVSQRLRGGSGRATPPEWLDAPRPPRGSPAEVVVLPSRPAVEVQAEVESGWRRLSVWPGPAWRPPLLPSALARVPLPLIPLALEEIH